MTISRTVQNMYFLDTINNLTISLFRALQVAESRQSRRRQNFRQYPGGGYGGGYGGGPGGFGGGGFQGGFPSNQFSSSNANANSQGFNAGGFGGSSAAANANSQGQYFGPNGFGSSAANAQSQAFNSQGPLGGFGASAANTQTQAFNVGPNGIQVTQNYKFFTPSRLKRSFCFLQQGSAALAGSQAYQLPGGQSLNVAYSNGFSIGPDGKPVVSNGNSISYTG
jgi:hypothetical protein